MGIPKTSPANGNNKTNILETRKNKCNKLVEITRKTYQNLSEHTSLDECLV